MTSVGLSGGLTCGYRSDGLRAWKQDNQGVRTYFLYDGGNPILELDSAGAVKNVNVFAPDGLVARKEGSSWTYYTFDPQGNVLNKLDASEDVTAGRLLDAWGQGVETTLPRNIDPWGYNAKWGYYYDRETALYLCQHRMYDASAGRWLNRDPIGLAGGMNLYGYCAGGPVGAADPLGFYGTGSFWGDAGQMLLGVGDALGLTHVPSAAEIALNALDPMGIARLNADFLSDPSGYVQGAVEGVSLWDTDDPREYGRRVTNFTMLIFGTCELAGLRPRRGAPPLRPGSRDGGSAGKRFSRATRAATLTANPDTCVYCRLKTSTPHVDHIIPRSTGGDATPANAQTTCPHCNLSKGARKFPVTPPSQYNGPWPPSHW